MSTLTTAGSRPSQRAARVERATRFEITDGRLRELVYRLLCLYWFLLPWEGVFRLAGQQTAARAVGGVVLVVAAFAVVRTGWRSPRSDYVALLLGYGAWVALSLAWTVTPKASEARLVTMVQLVISALITWEFARTRRRVLGLMSAWVVGGVVVGGIVIGLYAANVSETRYAAPGTHAGDQAYSLLLAIPMAWYLALVTRHRWLSVLYRLFVPFACFAVVLTASRAAALSAIAALLIIPVTAAFLTPRARGALAFAVVVVVGAGLGVLLSLASGPLARLGTTSSEISTGTLDHRTELWSIAVRLIGEHPVLGLGTGGARSAVAGEFVTDRVIHDTYLSIFVELGAVGIALFLLLGLAACYGALTRLPWLESRLAWVLALVFVISLVPRTDDYAKSTYALLTLFALMGTVLARRPAAQSSGPAPAATFAASDRLAGSVAYR